MTRIEITISPAGKSQLQTLGFEGAACESASRQLIASLGLVTKQERTAEYYSGTTATINQPSCEQE